MLKFDKNEHAYYLANRRLPNVTTILSPLTEYAGIPNHILDVAALRGNYVHKACEMFLWGTLDENSLIDEYRPYVDAFKQFIAETKFEPELIEERVYHAKLMYAGTIDMGGIIPPIGRKRKAHRALIDIKTTFRLLSAVGPQTAAYNSAWASQRPKAEHFDERYALQLKKDGSYKLELLKSNIDMNIFRSCLAIYNFMNGE